jgi:hypothetical protein
MTTDFFFQKVVFAPLEFFRCVLYMFHFNLFVCFKTKKFTKRSLFQTFHIFIESSVSIYFTFSWINEYKRMGRKGVLCIWQKKNNTIKSKNTYNNEKHFLNFDTFLGNWKSYWIYKNRTDQELIKICLFRENEN